MPAVHFRHNLICWEGNLTKGGQGQRNSASNKSNLNQICSDICCSMLKLVCLQNHLNQPAPQDKYYVRVLFSINMQNIAKYRMQNVTQRPSCSNPPFPSKTPEWGIYILLERFLFIWFPLAFHFHIVFHQSRWFHCLLSVSGKNTSDTFGQNAYYFLGVFGGWRGSTGHFTTAVSCESPS